ncbi:MAG: GntR family transcriptional regulator [Oscillospiraceae bacterium]|jgi:GntR family transcriptional regulator|nr:GntR family transcriptional regulator [Oscillospiraceae bacterium]
MAQVPRYKIVYDILKGKIKEGTYAVGSLLPTESEMERQFDVSRTTIRRAIGLLSAEGYVKVVQGRGSQVQDAFATQKLNNISSVTETLSQKGFTVSTQSKCIEKEPAPDCVAEALQVPTGTPVFKLQRVQCADGIPIAIMCNYLKISCAPDLDKHVDSFTSLYLFLEQHYHVIFKDAWEYLSAGAASFYEAQILGVPTGAPLLCSKRITSNETGPFEYGVIKLVADKYEYSIYLVGR